MFNPALHTATNKPIGLINKPVDARTYFYDEATFLYRQYLNEAEVLGYLIGIQRVGQFSIIINTGGSIIDDVLTGGSNAEWWFKDGIEDEDLLLKGSTGPVELSFTAGTELPIVISSFQTIYSAYGNYPTILILNATTGDEITNPTINRSPITAPTTVTINAADDGMGNTDSDILIIIKQ